MNKASFDTPFGEIELPLHRGKIAISCSGGADSIMVLYLLLAQSLNPKIFFIEKANSNYSALKECLSYLTASFNMEIEVETISREGEGHNLRPQIIALSERVDYLYTGVTKNPPFADEVPGAPVRPKANPTKNIITPFLALDKRASIYMYRALDIEELLEKTYSCTEESTIPCKQCFACIEREWAIKEAFSYAH